MLFYPVHSGNDKLEYYLALWTGLDDGFLELLGTSPLPDEVHVVSVGKDPKCPLRGWWFLIHHFYTDAAHLGLTVLESKRPSPCRAQMLPCTSSCEPSSVLGWKGEALAAHIARP